MFQKIVGRHPNQRYLLQVMGVWNGKATKKYSNLIKVFKTKSINQSLDRIFVVVFLRRIC